MNNRSLFLEAFLKRAMEFSKKAGIREMLMVLLPIAKLNTCVCFIWALKFIILALFLSFFLSKGVSA